MHPIEQFDPLKIQCWCTGMQNPYPNCAIVVKCHIKDALLCDPRERYDHSNHVFLSLKLHVLWDSRLINFDTTGKLFSTVLSDAQLTDLHVYGLFLHPAVLTKERLAFFKQRITGFHAFSLERSMKKLQNENTLNENTKTTATEKATVHKATLFSKALKRARKDPHFNQYGFL